MADSISWVQWISLVEIPVIAGGIWLFFRNQGGIACVKRDLDKFRLEVAKEYVSVSHLKEVEERIMGMLTRLDDKLDILRRSGS